MFAVTVMDSHRGNYCTYCTVYVLYVRNAVTRGTVRTVRTDYRKYSTVRTVYSTVHFTVQYSTRAYFTTVRLYD